MQLNTVIEGNRNTTMTPLSAKVYEAINKAIDADKLVLPTMPEMAVRVKEVVNEDSSSIKDLGKVIASDAALTARIIKVSNSPIYRGTTEIEDLNMALMRLGMATTSSLAIGLAMEQMFQATTDMVDRRLRKVWSESSEIAGICNLLCKHKTNLRPDQATLAGLVHQIGILPVLSFAEDHPKLLQDGMTLDKITEEVHPKIGARILKAWEFPVDIHNVPEDYLNFNRDIPKADYADIVTVAMIQSQTASGNAFDGINLQQVKSFDRLELDPDIETAEAEDLSEEMLEAMKMLH